MAFDPAIGAIAAAGVAALAATWNANRKLSGNVTTSEAETLWNEQREWRKEQSADIRELREAVRKLESRVRDAERTNDQLRHENDELKARNSDLAKTCERLRKDIDGCQKENEALKRTIRKAFPDA